MRLPVLRLSPQLIVIDRDHFRLRLFQMRGRRYKVVQRHEIALGQIGHETPTGLYWAESKTRKPDWLAPDSPWVDPAIRGQIFKFEDPRNPFDGGFISLAESGGVGIHGTKFDPKLGTKASHGCIRMAVPDFLQLYRALNTGAPVFIY